MSLTVVQSSVDESQLQNTIEAALLAAGRPLTENELLALFGTVDPPSRDALREVIAELQQQYEHRGIQLAKVASGWRVQVRPEMAPNLSRLWEARPPRFSRALLETLCLIAYRQPVTRGEIEDVRGVSVSVNIIRTLLDRNWVRVVGHRDVPGKPEMFGTTREFLDYFGLAGLEELPSLVELRDFDGPNTELDFEPELGAQAAMPDGDGLEAAEHAELEERAENAEFEAPAESVENRHGAEPEDQADGAERAESAERLEDALLAESAESEPETIESDKTGAQVPAAGEAAEADPSDHHETDPA